jgi:hypothetical protein
MMAAGCAAKAGRKVLLLEKNKNLGVKLLATGKERCNLTNLIGAWEMVAAFGPQGKFLFSALSQFDAEAAIAFFENLGVRTKVENNNRVFPQSNKSQDVLAALRKYLKDNGVEIETDAAVRKIIAKNHTIEKVILQDGREFFADRFIIAVGGKSYPATGSAGDGYKWLKDLGHHIVKPLPALAPIAVKEKYVQDLEGLTISGAHFSVWKNNKKIVEKTGDAIFTSNGLSGPAILAVSGAVSRNMPGVKMMIDFFPNENMQSLDLKLQNIFKETGQKQIKNVLDVFLPERLILTLLHLAKINIARKAAGISKMDRVAIERMMKEFVLEIVGVGDFDRAMLTTGGVDLKEVDSKTIRSKIMRNLFFAGEILDLDGPTGGFNLQMCWSTGVAAAEGAGN